MERVPTSHSYMPGTDQLRIVVVLIALDEMKGLELGYQEHWDRLDTEQAAPIANVRLQILYRFSRYIVKRQISYVKRTNEQMSLVSRVPRKRSII